MKHFKFNANPGHTKPKALALNLGAVDPAKAKRGLEMLAEGKMPLPQHLQGLSSGELIDLGYRKVLWSKKHGTKYTLIQPKRHDT